MLPPINPTVLSSNPKFNALYSDLCNNKLNPDGTSKLDAKAQRDHETLSEDLRKARTEAAKRDLLRSRLQELSYESSDLPEEVQQLLSVIAAILGNQIAEEELYLLRDDLTKFTDHVKQIDAALSSRLSQDAAVLSDMIDAENTTDHGCITLSIEKITDSTTSARTSLAQSRLSLAQETSTLHTIYRHIIERSIRILEQTIHGSMARDTKAKADYLALVAEGMSKKVNLQYGLLLSQLYSPDFHEALDRKHSDLQREDRSTARKISQAQERLNAYKAVNGMTEAAKEYAEVLKEIEKVKADITRLEKANR